MARLTVESWLPEQWGGAVLTKVRALSAIERYGRKVVMTSNVQHVPRSGGGVSRRDCKRRRIPGRREHQ